MAARKQKTSEEKIREILAAAEIELGTSTTLNGATTDVRFHWRRAKDAGIPATDYPKVWDYCTKLDEKRQQSAQPKESRQKPEPEPLPNDRGEAKAIGHPLTLPDHIKSTDHPTVWFLAQREALKPEFPTFLVCGDAPALVGFGGDGEMQLAPLKSFQKDDNDSAPSWMDEDEKITDLSCNLYALADQKDCLGTTAEALAWIKNHSANTEATTKGGFYLTSVTDFDRKDLSTTMGTRTALGLTELFLEWDDISPEEQRKRLDWLKGLGFSLTVVNSGNKSLHGHLHLTQMESFEDVFPVLKLLSALAGSDCAVVSKARRMRLAGAHRPNKLRTRGSAATNEQKLLERAESCYELSEVRRVLEAEATARGWLIDHIETRWTMYREARGHLRGGWSAPSEAWTRPEHEAMAWSKGRHSSGADGEYDKPVEWRQTETDLGAKIRHAEDKLFEKHGTAGAYELVANSGSLMAKQTARGWPGFEFSFASNGDSTIGQSPFSEVRASGSYSGTSLVIFEESQHFFCRASLRTGGLGEWAAYWCKYPVTTPDLPTAEEQSFIGLYLWELAGLDKEEFDASLDDKDDIAGELREDGLQLYQNARKRKLKLNEVLPKDIADLLSMRAKAFPVSDVALLPPFIAAMASMMGTRYQVQIKKGWKEPMVFWFGSVGPASSLKTPVTNQILWPLLMMDHSDQKTYKQKLKEYQAADGDDPVPPLPRKRVSSDATLEGLTAALDQERNYGMLCNHDELTSFIAQMDAYRGRSGPSKDRAHWLSMWSGQEINILRKNSENIFIPKTAVSVYGAVQQDKLTELLHGDNATAKSGDGFWARFLWCVPNNPKPLMNRDETEINAELFDICNAFDSLDNQEVTVHLVEEAWCLFAEQCDIWTEEQNNTYAARSAFLGKIRGYAARFAGFLHALEYVDRIRDHKVGGALHQIDRKISGDTMKRALKLAQFFIDQFDVLTPQVGGNGDLPHWVVKILELGEMQETVTARDILRKKWAEDTTSAKTLLQLMVSTYKRGRLVPSPRADQVWWSLNAVS